VTNLLKVEGVTKSFGGLQALSGCSLSVEKGSIAGLIGPNGSGKTTLFNVITGYVKPDAGTVTFEERDITGARPSQVFTLGVGRTFQITRIFPRITVLENMLVASQRQESWLRGLTRSKSSTQEVAVATEWLDFVGIARLAAQKAGALSFGRHSARRARRRGEPHAHQRNRGEDPLAQQRRQDLLDCGAQHGVRDADL
jgi:ABC-type branched-subunit amino acid transport system ATPase component